MNHDLLTNSIRVIEQNWQLILLLLACIAWGVLLVFATLKKVTGFRYSDLERMALAFGGWPLPALLVSFLIFLLQTILPIGIAAILGIIVVLSSAGVAIRSLWGKVSRTAAIPVSIFLFLAFIRLGFVNDAILPPYFDSAEHYRIIQVLLHTGNDAALAWPTSSYYHIGYHVIIAGIVRVASADIGQVMLLFGQFALAALPLPMYFLIYRADFEKPAAFFGVALAAFGWFMPAHAVNWGKYPALLSLALLQFTVGLAIIKNRPLTALAALATILIHTRAFVLLGILFVAWTLSIFWERHADKKRTIGVALILILPAALILLIARNPVLGPILEPYQVWVTLLAVLLSASVFRAFPRLIVFPVLVLSFMLLGLFIPVTSFLTLLDRPLVEMTLFLPLAFLGGLGFMRLPKFALPVLAALILFNAWLNYNFSPSECCQLASRDDTLAIDWMDRHIPKDARLAIAGAELNINAFGRPMRGAGVDAGIWVAPLTGAGRATVPLPHDTDFAAQDSHDLLCRLNITYIYIGDRPQSFPADFAGKIPEWYETIFSLPKAHIVKVINCAEP